MKKGLTIKKGLTVKKGLTIKKGLTVKKGLTMKKFMWPGVVVFVLIASLGGGIGIGTAIDSSSDSVSSPPPLKSTKIPIDYYYSSAWNTNRGNENLGNKELTLQDDFVIGLVTDGASTINDKSFNKGSMQGLLALYGLDENDESLYKEPTSSSPEDIESAYVSLLDDFKKKDSTLNKRIIVAPGNGHKEAIKRFWSTRKDNSDFDDVYFLLLDESGKNKDFKNTLGFEFDVSFSSFLGGYISALFLDSLGDPNPKVGLWGGENIPGVTSFMVGFVSGIKLYNDSYGVQKSYKPNIEIIKFKTDEDYVNSGFKAGDGRSKADYLIEKGADIIFQVAGAQIGDLVDAIKASSRKDEIKIVGVDLDQSKQFDADKQLFLTSVIKSLGKAVYEGYKYIMKGTGALADANVAPLPNNDENGTNNTSFVGNMDNGFSSYVKQFDTTNWQSDWKKQVWNEIYYKAELITKLRADQQLTTWEQSLNYIKSIV